MRFWFLLIALLLSACSAMTTNNNYVQTVASWRWGPSDKLLQVWGTPSKVVELPNGDKAYIYNKESYRNYPPPPPTPSYGTVTVANGKNVAVVPVYPTPSVGTSYLLNCTTTFEVDPRHVIVDVRARGNNCTADQGFVLSKSNPNTRRPHS